MTGFALDPLLDDPQTRILVCCGSGGVGKTTVSAAVALRAALRGRRVVVLTIDPARRLAQALGIEELTNDPGPVDLSEYVPAPGAELGTLDAMMLDMKSTFDELVWTQADPEKARQILENPFYVSLSTSFAGTQEYMAMERLGQLHRQAERTGRWDLIVVDTPPSRSALDFLDAPERISGFLDGRVLRLLTAPARGPARLVNAGVGLVTGALTKVIGAQFLRDLQTFVAAFDTLFGGFRNRAKKTYALLQGEQAGFLVIAAPTQEALREAAYFTDRLREERIRLAGLVFNRVTTPPVSGLDPEAARQAADSAGEQVADVLTAYADWAQSSAVEQQRCDAFLAAHPDLPVARIGAQAWPVADLEGLAAVGQELADPDPT